MNESTMTLAAIHQKGLEALARELGPVGMIRFLQQFETGSGDYSKERHNWLGAGDVRSLARRIQEQRPDET